MTDETQRFERMQHFVLPLILSAAFLTPASFALPTAVVESISIGETRRGEISGCQIESTTQKKVCEVLSYNVSLPADKYWRVEVEQLGIDLVLSVLPPDGAPAIEVNTPIERIGMESALLHAVAGGSYQLQVSSREHPKASGQYKIRVKELGSRTAEEQRRIEAEKAMTEAGAVFFKQEKAADAIPLYENAAKLWQALENPAEEARAAYCAGILYRDFDDAEKGRSYLVRALQLSEQTDDPNTSGYVLNDLGLTLARLGSSQKAKQRLQQARELNREVGDHYLEANTLSNQGLLFHYAGDLTNAKDYYEKAQRLFGLHDELNAQATIINNIAGIYYVLGEPDPAFERFKQALSLSRAIGNKEKEINALGNMAALYRITGDLKKALAFYVEILETTRAMGNRRKEAWTLDQVGLTYYYLGEYQRAFAFATEALPLWRKFSDRGGEASSLINLGEILIGSGKPRQALAPLDKAIALRKSSKLAVGEADALLVMGRAHLAIGDTVAAATSFDAAFGILKNVGDKRRQATALLLRGSVYIAGGAPEQALTKLNSALALHRSSRNQSGEAETLYQIAVAQRALGEIHEAQTNVAMAVTLIETIRTNITNPTLRSTFLGVKHDAYELSIDTLMALHRLEPEKGYQGKALEASERARARTLLDLLSEAGADIRRGVNPKLLKLQNALLREINAKTENQQGLLSREHSRAEARELEFELQSKLSELDDLETRIRTLHPDYASLNQLEALGTAGIQDLLDPDTLVLEYALGEQRSFLWVVTNDALHSVELPSREEIEATARQLFEETRRLDPQAWKDERKSRAALAQLLLAPVAEHLDKRRIVIVADGALHYVPFGALPRPAGPINSARQDVLLQDHEILYLPSASTLAALRGTLVNRRKASKQIAILGDPVFELSDPRLQTIEATASFVPEHVPNAKDSTRQASTQELQRLIFSRGEATTIAGLVPERERLLALDFDASRATALSEQIGQYDIVHFATHGMLNSQNPELSGLTLSRYDKTGANQAGFLGLHDVYNLKLAASLVVLSGCETALGKEIRGEGLVGLTRGFMYAGAPRVLASLWRVSDKVTAELMGRFYRAMFDDGLEPAAALRVAQLSIKTDPEQRGWRDPYYWAGFVLQGDWQ